MVMLRSVGKPKMNVPIDLPAFTAYGVTEYKKTGATQQWSTLVQILRSSPFPCLYGVKAGVRDRGIYSKEAVNDNIFCGAKALEKTDQANCVAMPLPLRATGVEEILHSTTPPFTGYGKQLHSISENNIFGPIL